MKRMVCIMAAVVLLLAGLAVWQVLHRQEAPQTEASGAALGLMLLEKETPRGLYVLAVAQESPADKAGIHPGDYLLQAGDAQLETAAQLDELITSTEALPITLLRDSRKLNLTLPTR